MKRKIKELTAMLLAVAMLLTCIPATAFAAKKVASSFKPTKGQTIIVTAPHGVNMRKEPGEKEKLVLALACGTHLTVNEVRTNGWMEVTCGAYTGWVENAASSDTGNWFGPYDDTPDVRPYADKQAKVLASVLNVHKKPIQQTTNIIDDLAKGQVVDAVGYTSNGWTKVQYYRGATKITGYVSSIWIKLITIKPTDQYTVPEQFTDIYGWSAQVKSNCSALNVHISPNINAQKITCIYAGDVVNILAESASWYRISLTYGGKATTGYIKKSYTNVLDAMENLRLSKKTVTLKKGKKYHILVRGNTTGMTLTTSWKTSNKKIATVSKRGYVTAKKKGKATITCTIKVGNQKTKLKCKVTVK